MSRRWATRVRRCDLVCHSILSSTEPFLELISRLRTTHLPYTKDESKLLAYTRCRKFRKFVPFQSILVGEKGFDVAKSEVHTKCLSFPEERSFIITDCIWSMGEGNVFTGVCHCVHPGCTPLDAPLPQWMLPQMHALDVPTMDAPLLDVPPMDAPLLDAPSSVDAWPSSGSIPSRQKTDGQQAVGTHCTRIHTYFKKVNLRGGEFTESLRKI